MKNSNFKVFIFISLVLVYIETLTLFGVLISHIWKSFLLLSIIFYIVYGKKRLNFLFSNKISFILFLYAIKNIVNTSSFTYTFESLLYTYKLLYIPILLTFFTLFFKEQTQLLSFLKNLSVLILLSTIPFLIGIIEPLGKGYNLDVFEISENSSGFVGIFQGPHFASASIAFACLTTLHFFLQNKGKFLLFLIVLGVYVLFKTYVRTGMVMFGFGSLILLWKSPLFGFNKVHKIFTFFLLFGLIVLLYKSDDVLQMRLADKTNSEYHDNKSYFERFGSGRLVIAFSSIQVFLQSDLIEKFTGIGQEELKKRNGDNIGIAVYSHNGFIDYLLFNGIIGFIIYMFFYYHFWRMINESAQFKAIGMAFFAMFIIYNLVQGGEYFFINVFVMLIISLLFNDKSYRYTS